jgi:hypothetical protein
LENESILMGQVRDINATKLIDDAMKQTEPRFDTIISASFQYEASGRWFSVDVTMHEYLQMLQSGELDGKKLVAVEVSVTNCDNEAGDKVKIVYDFMKLHTGSTPWRML